MNETIVSNFLLLAASWGNWERRGKAIPSILTAPVPEDGEWPPGVIPES